ncbi:MAG: hypothetical protein JW722_07040 [Demequinaceae bacterium]|nr:hypothetical protein [Demequinaceae bacterium]
MTGLIVELAAIASMLVGGACLMASLGMKGWGLALWGFAVGVFLTIAVGFVQVATPLPGSPLLTMAVVGGGPLAWWGWKRRSSPVFSIPIVGSAVVTVLATVIVTVNRGLNTYTYHSDSLEYLGLGALLADDHYTEAVTGSELDKRLVGVSLLHAPARLAGEYYLAGVTPLIATAVLGIVAWIVSTRAIPVMGRGGAAAVASLGVLALASMNRFVFHAVYLNGHLLTALGVLALAGACWMMMTGSTALGRAPGVVAGLAAVALVLTRPEGPFLALAAIVPVVASGKGPGRAAALLVGTLGAGMAAWYGFAATAKALRGLPQGFSPMMALAGLLLGVAAFAVSHEWGRILTSRLVIVYEVGLLVVLAAFILRDSAIFTDSVRAIYANDFGPYSWWGSAVGVLAFLVVLSVVSGQGRGLAAFRLPVTTFIPLGLILAYARGTAFRPFDADSFNRMLIEIVPLAVAYVLMTAMGSRTRSSVRAEVG